MDMGRVCLKKGANHGLLAGKKCDQALNFGMVPCWKKITRIAPSNSANICWQNYDDAFFEGFYTCLPSWINAASKQNPAAGPAGSILKRISLSPGPGVLCHVHGEMIQWTALKCWGTRHRDATTFRKFGISEPNFCRCLHRQSSSEGPRRQFVFKEWQLPKCVYQPKSSKRQGALKEVSNANGKTEHQHRYIMNRKHQELTINCQNQTISGKYKCNTLQ